MLPRCADRSLRQQSSQCACVLQCGHWAGLVNWGAGVSCAPCGPAQGSQACSLTPCCHIVLSDAPSAGNQACAPSGTWEGQISESGKGRFLSCGVPSRKEFGARDLETTPLRLSAEPLEGPQLGSVFVQCKACLGFLPSHPSKPKCAIPWLVSYPPAPTSPEGQPAESADLPA